MDAQTVLLTDDELVAVALDRESFWPGPLPTVDIEDVAALTAAALRGQRSLFVRGLLAADRGLDPDLDREIAPLAGQQDCRTVYLADAGFQRASWAYASTHHPAGTRWIVEEVTAAGVHRFVPVSSAENREYFRILLATAVEAGPGTAEEGEPAWLCITAAWAGGAGLVAARRGEVRYLDLGEDGQVTSGDSGEHVPDVEAALDRLLPAEA